MGDVIVTSASAARRIREVHAEQRYRNLVSGLEEAIGHFLRSTNPRDTDVRHAVPVDLADRLVAEYRAAGWNVITSRGALHVDVVLRLPAPVQGVHPERRQVGDLPVLDFWRFVFERQRIHQRRSSGLPRPWTDDPVLRDRFFTNIFRDLDPGTVIAADIVTMKGRPAWERLWNLMVYRRFNREETWEMIGGYRALASTWPDGDLETLREYLRNLYILIARKRAETGQPIFTDAHQVYPMPTLGGPADVTSRLMRVMLDLSRKDREPDSVYSLADKLAAARTRREAYRAFVNARIPGVSNFLSWQMTMDCTYGPEPIVKADDDWAPITTGARFGAIMWKEWPKIGTVNYPIEGWPSLPSTPPVELERFVQGMRDEQDERFEERGLDWLGVSGGRRLDMAALEHALCEYSKYVAAAVGLPTRDRWAQAPQRGGGRRGTFNELADDVQAAMLAIDHESITPATAVYKTDEAFLASLKGPGLVEAVGHDGDEPKPPVEEPASDGAPEQVTRPAGSAHGRFRAAVLAIHERGEDPTPRAIFAELGMQSVSLNTRQAAWRREILAELGYVREGQRYVRGDA